TGTRTQNSALAARPTFQSGDNIRRFKFAFLSRSARPALDDVEPACIASKPRPLRSGAQHHRYQPNLRPTHDAEVCDRLPGVSRDASSQTSSPPERKPALCASPRFSGRGEAVSRAGKSKAIA